MKINRALRKLQLKTQLALVESAERFDAVIENMGLAVELDRKERVATFGKVIANELPDVTWLWLVSNPSGQEFIAKFQRQKAGKKLDSDPELRAAVLPHLMRIGR